MSWEEPEFHDNLNSKPDFNKAGVKAQRKKERRVIGKGKKMEPVIFDKKIIEEAFRMRQATITEAIKVSALEAIQKGNEIVVQDPEGDLRFKTKEEFLKFYDSFG